MANNITDDNETLTEYDQINDPKLSPKDPPMTIPLEWDNPFRIDNRSQRNILCEQCAHLRLCQPSNQSFRALRNGLLSPRKSLPIINYGMRRFKRAGDPGIQGGGPDSALGTGEAIYISERPFPQQT